MSDNRTELGNAPNPSVFSIPPQTIPMGAQVPPGPPAKKGAKTAAPVDDKVGEVVELDGVRAAFELRDLGDPKALPDLADRMKNQLGDPGVVVLGAGGEGKASLLVAATPGAVERGVKAGDIVKVAAKVVGGGGGGRDTMAQAGGKQPEKLPEALQAAREAIERALGV